MEPNIKTEPLPFPDRRNRVRRSEDMMKIRNTEAVEAILPELAKNLWETLGKARGHSLNRKALRDEIEASASSEVERFKLALDHCNMLDQWVTQASDHVRTIHLLCVPTHCQMELMLEKVRGWYRSRAEKDNVSVSIQCHGLETFPAVHYEWLFEEIFHPVFGRAIRVTERGGSITVSARADQADATVLLVVEDTGRSIAQRFCDVLNSGQELNEKETVASGANNALDLFKLQEARKILESHGGRLAIESRDGVGTKCSMSFPIV